jgi:O-methyltransferase
MNLTKRARTAIFQAAYRLGYTIKRNAAAAEPHYLELDPIYSDIIQNVRPYTMTSVERIGALVDSVRYIGRAEIPGCIVECGVWRGGSMMAVALTLMEAGDIRDLYMFDTYAGMTQPADMDVDYRGTPAEGHYHESIADGFVDWCYATLEDVRHNLLSTGYPEDRIHFVKGDVMDTIPCPEIAEIAILRLDTDWYASTRHELEILYPMVVDGGILIIDDYGHWQGCKKAVDEYFGPQGPFMCGVDDTCRLIVKSN